MKHSRYTGINNNQAGLPFSAAVSGHRFGHCLILVLFFALMLSASPIRGQEDSLLCATSVYQGLEASDAFTAMHYLGSGRIIAGKRSSQAATRFLLSSDYGLTWDVVGCPSSTGAHTYFFGQNGPLVFSGTGDTGNACLMKSTDTGVTWSVALTSGQIRSLLGTANALAVFGPVYLGSNRWMVNVKTIDTVNKVFMSTDNGATWFLPSAQPGQNAAAWARRMILTGDDILLWPSCTTERMYLSSDFGSSWSWTIVPGASLFQPLCDAGSGVYLCGDVRTTPDTPIHLYRSNDRGLSWVNVASVNLRRPSLTYWRDVINAGDSLLASACCAEGSSTERFMQLFQSSDNGLTWESLGNPYFGPYGGMQAIYQMCVTETDTVFAGCQPDSTILRWQMPNRFCNADVNNDHIVDELDRDQLEICLDSPAIGTCESADLNCDQWINWEDLDTWICRSGSGSVELCCGFGQVEVPAESHGSILAALLVIFPGIMLTGFMHHRRAHRTGASVRSHRSETFNR